MRQSEWDDALRQIEADVAVLAGSLTGAVERVREWIGPRLSGGGSEGSRGHSAGSNVESQALSGQRDEFGRRLAHASEDLTMVRLGLGRLVKFVNAVTPVPAEESDLYEAGCVNCRTVGHWSPVYKQDRNRSGPGRPPKDADPPVALCSFCYDFKRVEGRLPDRPILEKHAAQKRISQADIDRLKGRGA